MGGGVHDPLVVCLSATTISASGAPAVRIRVSKFLEQEFWKSGVRLQDGKPAVERELSQTGALELVWAGAWDLPGGVPSAEEPKIALKRA